MLKKTGRGPIVAVMVTLALTGCTSRPSSDHRQVFQRATVSEGEAKLGNATMAFFVGPQNDEMHSDLGEVHKPGYVVLVDADGSFRTVETWRMDMMRPVWSEQGLAFADEGYDYRLTASGLTKSANPKIAAQNLMFALPTGESVGIFNGGRGTGDAYNNRVAIAADGDTRSYDVQGNYFTGARCDGQVFGLTNTPGTHAVEAPKSPDMVSASNATASPQRLARLYPAGDDGKVIAWRPNLGFGTPIGQVPCHNGVITFLSWDTDASGREEPKVVSWDTTTGRYQEHTLIFADATKLNLDDFGYVVQNWQNGKLHWVYADGRVFSTDTTTGKTTALFDTSLGTGSTRPTKSLYAFSDSQLHILSTTPGAEGNVEYAVFDRTNGETIRRVSVPIPNNEVNVSYLNLTHMTVPPKP